MSELVMFCVGFILGLITMCIFMVSKEDKEIQRLNSNINKVLEYLNNIDISWKVKNDIAAMLGGKK